jgi:hypothetical protein
MDLVLAALIQNRDMYRCAAVFDGEGRGIESILISNIVSKVNYGTGGLDERQSKNHIHHHMGPSGNEDACEITFLG